MNFKFKSVQNCRAKAVLSLLFLLSTICVESCRGGNILIYFIQGTYSQLHVYHPYGVALANRGHNVTFLIGRPYKNPHPNVTYIVPEAAARVVKKTEEFLGENLLKDRQPGVKSDWFPLNPGGIEYCDLVLNDPQVQTWLRSPSTTFDLVVVDALWNDCGIGLAYKFSAPHILFETCTVMPWEPDTFGFPAEHSWVPDIRGRAGSEHGQLSFLERVRSIWDNFEMYFVRQFYFLDELDEVIRKGLADPEMPSIRQLEKSPSLVFLNSYFTSEAARSLPPLFVQVGALQCQDVTESQLPTDMAKFVEKFPAGFVLVSFGTIFQLKWKEQEVFLEAFRKFPQVGFIFRWNGEMPENKEHIPENALLTKWVPQTDLLAHKKILAFVSHAGMLSTQESVFFGVPVVAIPGCYDQDYNAECLRRLGVAVRLEIIGLTQDHLTGALRDILYDSNYKKKMTRLSKLHRDRPQSPMETAMWWTEYVLRNTADGQHLSHLIPLGVNLNWFQRRDLDIWLFLAVLFVAAFSFILSVLRLVFRCIFRGSQSRTAKTEKGHQRSSKKSK